MSDSENILYRNVIRTSWGSPSIPGVKTRLAFMLGYSTDKLYQDKIRNESLLHGDIVQGNFLDSYRNLTYKTVLGHMWVSSFCTQAEFVMKADDDIYLDLYGLYTVASRYIEDKVNLKIAKHTITYTVFRDTQTTCS